MNEPLSKRRSTAVSIDLLGLKDQWIAWCASQGMSPSQVRISANVTDDFGNVTGLSGRC